MVVIVQSIIMEVTGFEAPVQIRGAIDGIPFYFRARYNKWEFGAIESDNLSIDPVDVLLDEGETGGFYRTGDYDPDRNGYSADYMPVYIATALIEICSIDLSTFIMSKGPG